MSLELVTSIWGAMKPLFSPTDRPEAAEVFVDTLIDNDYDPTDLKKAFRKDKHILNAIGLHCSDEEEHEDTDWHDDDDDDIDDDY